MEGRLIFDDGADLSHLALGKKEPVLLGGKQAEPGGQPVHAVIEWVWSQSNWVLSKHPGSDAAIRMGGGELPAGERIPLTHLGVVKCNERELRFERILADPTVEGRPASEIELIDGVEWMEFGRGDPKETPENGAVRVCLDREDLRISSRHASLRRDGHHFVIQDHSKTGTFLNGGSFSREPLVYGDRFRIGDYVFEFLVTKIRRVDHEAGGRIQARELEVTVDKKGEGARRGEKLAILSGVNLDFHPGEFVGILGGSGQGKSTLMNALCGINPATGGKVYINGIEISDRAAMIAAGIGYVPQDDIVHPELTVTEAVDRCARLRLNLPRHAVDALVSRVLFNLGLEPHRFKRVRDLSGGQRKRVSIATELLSRPAVLFLDEPTSGLDPATEAELMGWLQNLSNTGTTVVCTTHVIENAHLFDRLLFVQGGRVVFAGDHIAVRAHFLQQPGGSEFSQASQSMLSQSMGGRKLASLVKVYSALSSSRRSAEEWERSFLASPHHVPVSPEIQRRERPEKRDSSRKVGSLTTLWHLVARQWLVLRADPLNLCFLFAQAALIGLMIAWVADGPVLRGFLAIVATLWFGCSNGAQQIVRELPVFRRERVSGQGLNPYVFSKFFFLTALTAAQAMALLLVIQGTTHLVSPLEWADGKDVKFENELSRRLFTPPAKPASPSSGQPVEDREMLLLLGGVDPEAAPEDAILVEGSPGLFRLGSAEDLFFTVQRPDDWFPGKVVELVSGEKARLPANLPPYPQSGFPASAVIPGAAESPFAPGIWRKFGREESDLWMAGMMISCRATGQLYALPTRLPPWPTDTWRYRLAKAFIAFFLLHDAFLDSGESASRPDLADLPLAKLLAFTLGLKVAVLLVTACVGVAIGLTISALVQNDTQAVLWVPLVLIPQILFGGFVVTVPEMSASVRAASRAVPSFAAQRAMDVSHVFGRIVPKVSNDTKLPVFSDGGGEEVTWEEGGNEIRQRYDKAVDENISWQNLLVMPERVGRRQIEEKNLMIAAREGGRLEEIPQGATVDLSGFRDFKATKDRPRTVEARRDVRPAYGHGSRFIYIREAQVALMTLAAWLFGCYLVILGGLASKQTGK